MSVRAVMLAALVIMSLTGCAASSEEPAEGGAMGMAATGEPASDEQIMMGGLVASKECTVTTEQAAVVDGVLVVPYVHAPTDGWVVVRSAVSPGEVLGYAAVPEGESRNVEVKLAAADGYAVRVALHGDRGASGVFEFDAERPERSSDGPYYVGSVAVEQFTELTGFGEVVSANSASLLVDESQAVKDAISVRYVLTPGPSWVVVSLWEGGLPGKVVGYAPRKAGETFEVSVPVSGVGEAEELYVTMHADLGAADVFEYDNADPLGSEDPPFVSAGVVVSQRVRTK